MLAVLSIRHRVILKSVTVDKELHFFLATQCSDNIVQLYDISIYILCTKYIT